MFSISLKALEKFLPKRPPLHAFDPDEVEEVDLHNFQDTRGMEEDRRREAYMDDSDEEEQGQRVGCAQS